MPDEEIIARKVVPIKEPGCLYFLDADGNVVKRKKSGLKHKMRKKYKIYTDLNLTVPRILLTSYISQKIKTVRKIGKGAYLSMPKDLIGMRCRIILIPENELENIREDTVNIF